MTSRSLTALVAVLWLVLGGSQSSVTSPSASPPQGKSPQDSVGQLGDFPVIEFRRYPLLPGQQHHFATFFDAFFPETFEQLGAITFGSFTERGTTGGFTEIRGFRNLRDRAIVSAQFYYGPVWKEHRNAVNSMLSDADDRIMLMKPLNPASAIPVLPSVDPRVDPRDAPGIVMAEIFAVKKGAEDTFARRAERMFARYRAVGVRQVGILVSLDAPNNFPQLPISTDGPFVIWLGVAKDDQTLRARFAPLVDGTSATFSGTGLLRSLPELLILDPTERSRLRWLPVWN